MARNTKISFKVYSAWNYEKEIEDLNKASEEGWQLKKGGGFHSTFTWNPDVRYRYQLDYGKIDDMGRYIETFREQGWEYVNSTFNGWHYLRKVYDPSLPEEAYEIFTDRQSLKEMNRRWARFALIIGLILAAFAVFWTVRTIMAPSWPRIIRLITFAFESGVLIFGVLVMMNPDTKKNRRGDNLFIVLFIAGILLGVTASTILDAKRPHFQSNQTAGSIETPVADEQWTSFKVPYQDFYYLDVDLEGEKPVTMKLLNEAGEVLYTGTGTDLHKKNVQLRLPKGAYRLTLSVESGFKADVVLD